MSAKTKSSRGRPATLTDSGRKRNRKEVLAKLAKSRINLGTEYERWVGLKEELSLGSHAEVRLLDR